ncbi:amidohydrolase family protein [candidate division KSB1 bacterium]|nr:amidohydrolase family protein [candidate division KSB1 bacterium]
MPSLFIFDDNSGSIMITESLALLNGRIWTVDKEKPWANAIFIRGDKIAAVGSNSEIREQVTKETRVIDLDGAFAMPGFNDAHVDFYRGAVSLQSVKLGDAEDEQDFAARIRGYVQQIPPGEWVTEGNWNHENWESQRLPRKELIDPFTQSHPVIVCRMDEHISLANSLALELAGITEDTPNPAGGEIRKDPETGEPTGILVDTAQELVLSVIPEPEPDNYEAIIKQGMRHAASLGITSIQDNTTGSTLRIFQKLLRKNELTLKVNAWRPVRLLQQMKDIGMQAAFGNDMIRLGVMKIFADGSMGAGSALFFDQYTDDPSTSGIAIYSEEELTALIVQIDRAGLQVSVHAIGDKANHWALNAFQKARENNPDIKNRRHRIEHAQVVTPEDLLRFRELDIVGSVQPSHCIDDMKWAEKRIGERVKQAFLWDSFLKNKVQLAFGTDWPVAPLNPFVTLYAAVARRPIQGEPESSWFEDEKLSLEHAIECYTLGSAYAEFAENVKGSLERGKYADIVVLSQNPFQIEPKKLLNTDVLYTIVNGKIIYHEA